MGKQGYNQIDAVERAVGNGGFIAKSQGGERILPYHGTIFTAKIPDSKKGGVGSTISLSPYDSIFNGYKGVVSLGHSDLISEGIWARLRPGDLCRFVVDDTLNETNHSIDERNWFMAVPIRPIIGRRSIALPQKFLGDEATESSGSRTVIEIYSPQAVIAPVDSMALIDSALNGISIQSNRPQVNNDYTWFSYLRDEGEDKLQAVKDLLARLAAK